MTPFETHALYPPMMAHALRRWYSPSTRDALTAALGWHHAFLLFIVGY